MEENVRIVYVVMWVYSCCGDERRYVEGIYDSDQKAKDYIVYEKERGSSSKYEIDEWEVE